MRNSNMVVKVKTANQRGEKRNRCCAAPHRLHLDSSGSQESGMITPSPSTSRVRLFVSVTPTYDALDKDDNVKTLPLFTNINACTQRYRSSRPNRLLLPLDSLR